MWCWVGEDSYHVHQKRGFETKWWKSYTQSKIHWQFTITALMTSNINMIPNISDEEGATGILKQNILLISFQTKRLDLLFGIYEVFRSNSLNLQSFQSLHPPFARCGLFVSSNTLTNLQAYISTLEHLRGIWTKESQKSWQKLNPNISLIKKISSSPVQSILPNPFTSTPPYPPHCNSCS